MKKNKTIKCFILLYVCFSFDAISQERVKIEELLNKIWKLDTENLAPRYKYENYEQFVFFEKNIRYQANYYPKDKETFKGSLQEVEYHFLSDSVMNIFISKEYDNDSLIIKFFNDIQNKSFLRDTLSLDFTNKMMSANIIHIKREGFKIIDAHLYTYDFFNENVFIQYGYGWTPGQPQSGLVYNSVNSIPIDIIKKIKELKKKKLKTILVTKSNLFNTPNVATKMYLVKGDEIEILEKRSEWLKIRYYGKKIVEGWIKKSDVE